MELEFKKKKSIPYDFVLEEVASLRPTTKPMFGCTAVYSGLKIIFILRKKEDFPKDNGVWLATTAEHHESLQKIFPNMRSLGLFGGGTTGWQILAEDTPDFEESVLRACDLVLKGDLRIGKIPKSKLPSKKKTKKKSYSLAKKRKTKKR